MILDFLTFGCLILWSLTLLFVLLNLFSGVIIKTIVYSIPVLTIIFLGRSVFLFWQVAKWTMGAMDEAMSSLEEIQKEREGHIKELNEKLENQFNEHGLRNKNNF